MLFLFGTRLFGRVDEVPKLFYVATRFVHVLHVPLVPRESYVVLFQDEEEQWKGVAIPVSFKSASVAWARAFSSIGMVALGAAAISALGLHAPYWRPLAVAAALSAMVYVISTMFNFCTHASYARACLIADRAGMGERAMHYINRAFGVSETEDAGDAPGTFFISGIDAITGEEVCRTISASTPDEARKVAMEDGVKVQGVEPGGK